jgi:hypothetical protein
MPILLTCSCGRKLQAQEEHAGRLVKCPACGAEMTVPKADAEAVQPAEAAAPKPSPVQPAPPRRAEGADDDSDAEHPRRRSRREEDDEDDDRPRRSRRREDGDEHDDRPRRRRSRDDEDDDYGRRRREPEGSSGKAVAALVLGFLSCCVGLTAIPGVTLGIWSLVDISRSRGRLGGKWLAITGLVVNGLGGVTFAVGLVVGILGFRDTASRIKAGNDMHELVLAMHRHCDVYGRLPDATPETMRRPMPVRSKLSWRVQLLPYLGHDNLYRQFHHDEPWDSPHNKRLLTPMPKVFAHPKYEDAEAQGLTYYRVFTGQWTPFPPEGGVRFPAGITDGTSNTIFIVEAADPVPWTKPDELPYDPAKPLPKLGGHFRSGFVVGMGDGSSRVVGPGVSEKTLRAAITPNGGEVLGADW